MLTELRYLQLYATPDGETHFRDVTVPLTFETTAPPAAPYAQSAIEAATTIRHVAWPPRWGCADRDHGVFHNTAHRRFVTLRQGLMWVRASDGDTRRLQPGDLLELLDVRPSKGHITWVGDEPAVALYSTRP